MSPEQQQQARTLVKSGVLPYVALRRMLRLCEPQPRSVPVPSNVNHPDTSRPVEPSTTPPSSPPAASTTVTYPEQGCQINISDGPPKNGWSTYTPPEPYGDDGGHGHPEESSHAGG